MVAETRIDAQTKPCDRRNRQARVTSKQEVMPARSPVLGKEITPDFLEKIRVRRKDGVVGVEFHAPRQVRFILVPFVPVGEQGRLQHTEGTSLIHLLFLSIPTAPTKTQ